MDAGAQGPGGRDADRLLADAHALRRLLDDVDEDDVELRLRLLAARTELRAEAAVLWRRRGWDPIR